MTLKGTTKRLRQLIREHGAHGWEDVRRMRVACFNGDVGVFVISPDKRHTRWVRPTDLEEESK